MFKKLKSYFIVEDEEFVKQSQKKSTEPEADQPPVSKEEVEAISSQITPSSSQASAGKVSTKFTDILLKAIEKNNIEGFDYLEFKQALQNLKKMPMDEQTRFQSAFAMAQTMNITPARLIETANFYLGILKEEEQKFANALSNQRGKQVGDKEQKLIALNETIQDKARKIELLGKEIEQHQQQMVKLKEEIDGASLKVETTKNNFVASYESLVAQI
ncbi:MAG: hypothetical protein AAGG75_27255, partial [Bacteroidota bacterium]